VSVADDDHDLRAEQRLATHPVERRDDARFRVACQARGRS